MAYEISRATRPLPSRNGWTHRSLMGGCGVEHGFEIAERSVTAFPVREMPRDRARAYRHQPADLNVLLACLAGLWPLARRYRGSEPDFRLSGSVS